MLPTCWKSLPALNCTMNSLATLQRAISDARAAGVAHDLVEVAEARLREVAEQREGAMQRVAALAAHGPRPLVPGAQ